MGMQLESVDRDQTDGNDKLCPMVGDGGGTR